MADHPYIGPAFAEDTKPGWLIGQMLIGYGEVEYEIASLLGAAYENAPLSLRAMFRMRGETARVQVADALLRPKCVEKNLQNKWDVALKAINYCKRVRNQYSHCHWYLEAGDLWFYNMEVAAEGNSDDFKFDFEHVDLPLLMMQTAYFNYTRCCLIHLQNQFGFFGGKRDGESQEWPKELNAPKRSNQKMKLSDLMKQEDMHNPQE
jgi:hypothetical protein